MSAAAKAAVIEFPPIPQKRYLAIGEVSRLCMVKPHVLRYWEQEFPQLNPVKRRGNRRYYQIHEVKLIRRIHNLLYVDGFTISGARIQLQQAHDESDDDARDAGDAANAANPNLIGRLIDELNEVRDILR